jgi:hypothetical protein
VWPFFPKPIPYAYTHTHIHTHTHTHTHTQSSAPLCDNISLPRTTIHPTLSCSLPSISRSRPTVTTTGGSPLPGSPLSDSSRSWFHLWNVCQSPSEQLSLLHRFCNILFCPKGKSKDNLTYIPINCKIKINTTL